MSASEMIFLREATIAVPRGSPTIALTPTALHQLTLMGREPTTLSDVVDPRSLRHDASGYLRWQSDWLHRLDARLDLKGGGVAAAHLIKAPMDSLIVAARRVYAAVSVCAPMSVVYVGAKPASPQLKVDPWHDGHLQFRPIIGDEPLVAQLLPLIARQLDLPIREVRWEESSPKNVDTTSIPPRFRQKLIRGAAIARNFWTPKRVDRSAPASLMLWSTGYGARLTVQDERERSRRVLLLVTTDNEYRIVETGPMGLHVRWRSPARSVRTGPSSLPASAEQLLGEVEEWTGVQGASELLRSRLASFVSQVVPTIVHDAETLAHGMASVGISTVVAANPHSVADFAALLAAKSIGAHRTLIQHGDHLFSYDPWVVTETHNFEEMVCSDPTVPVDLSNAGARLGVRIPTTRMGSPRLRQIQERRRVVGPRNWSALPVCYLPTMFVDDSYVFGGSYFEDSWYLQWQLQLLDEMARRRTTEFVWKALPTSNQAHDPIPKIIAEREVANVTYVTDPFLRVLPGVGQIITDFGSTGLYEAILQGHPALAIVFGRFADIRPSAAAHLDPVIRICETEADALHAINDFLSGDATDWILPGNVLSPASG